MAACRRCPGGSPSGAAHDAHLGSSGKDRDDQRKTLLIAGPEQLRERYRDLSTAKLVTALLASRPSHEPVSADEATAYALKTLAARHRLLTQQVNDLTRQIRRLLQDHAAALMAVFGAGPDTVAQLLITAGDNPDRLRSERHLAGRRPPRGMNTILSRPNSPQTAKSALGRRRTSLDLRQGSVSDRSGCDRGGMIAVESGFRMVSAVQFSAPYRSDQECAVFDVFVVAGVFAVFGAIAFIAKGVERL